jgi:hypothetical protein
MIGGRFSATASGLVAVVLVVAGVAGPAQAQTKISKPPAGGFPIKITKSGGYILTNNLPVGALLVNAINVTASNVSIDLNGFTIAGPGGGTGIGINAAGVSNVTILNGTVTSMGGSGIALGDNGTVHSVRLIGNGGGSSGGDGIVCGVGCLVIGCIASGNAKGDGLDFPDTTSGYQNNVMLGNVTPVAGGTNMGGNVCNGAKCP